MTLRTVVGYIIKFDRRTGEGIAQTSEIDPTRTIDVRFNASYAHVAAWDSQKQMWTITGDIDHESRPRVERTPMPIVMNVRRTGDHWQAFHWAHRPGPNWSNSMIQKNSLHGFKNCRVAVTSTSVRSHETVLKQEYTAVGRPYLDPLIMEIEIEVEDGKTGFIPVYLDGSYINWVGVDRLQITERTRAMGALFHQHVVLTRNPAA